MSFRDRFERKGLPPRVPLYHVCIYTHNPLREVMKSKTGHAHPEWDSSSALSPTIYLTIFQRFLNVFGNIYIYTYIYLALLDEALVFENLRETRKKNTRKLYIYPTNINLHEALRFRVSGSQHPIIDFSRAQNAVTRLNEHERHKTITNEDTQQLETKKSNSRHTPVRSLSKTLKDNITNDNLPGTKIFLL